MDCQHWEDLNAYVDGLLTHEEAAKYERHLFQCRECREAYRALRELRNELVIEAPPVVLPLRLELALEAKAAAFKQSTSSAHAAELRAPSTTLRPARQLLIAAALTLFALTGMSFFAARSGQVPSLSSVEQHIPGLGSFGTAALRMHLERGWGIPSSRYSAAENDARMSALLGRPAGLIHPHLGGPLEVRVVELEGEEVVMAEYYFNGVIVSQFVLPIEVAAERLEVEANEELMACTIPEFHACFGDDLGTSVCIEAVDGLARLWVAHMPRLSLDKLVHIEH